MQHAAHTRLPRSTQVAGRATVCKRLHRLEASPRLRAPWVSCSVIICPTNKPKLSYIGLPSSGAGSLVAKAGNGLQLEGGVKLVPPKLTKSDEEFAEMGLEFVTTLEGLDIGELNFLFEKVGFPRRDPERLLLALQNTHRMVWIRATRHSRFASYGQLVGFARATSDGALYATIWDVAVLPSWQRLGLGRALMERLTGALLLDGIPTVTLYAEPNVVRLYEKLGYVKDPEGIKGMALKTSKINGTDVGRKR